MFKEKYKKDNQNIRLEKESRSYILYKLTRQADTPPPQKRPPVRRLVAAALSLALVVGCGAIFIHNPNNRVPQITQLQTGADYGQLYALSRSFLKEENRSPYIEFFSELIGGNTKDAVTEDYADTEATGNSAPGTAVNTSGDTAQKEDYSATNTQHNDVDEADIVKTDGQYIYTLSHSARRVSILQAAGADTKLLSNIYIPAGGKGDGYYSHTTLVGMYIYGERLVLVISQDTSAGGYYGMTIYDISDPTEPKKIKQLLQSGWGESTRMVDGVVYLISRYYVQGKIEEQTPAGYVPGFVEDDTTTLCPAEDIAICPQPQAASYTVIGAVDVAQATRVSQKSVFGGGNTVYATTQNIYIAASTTKENTTITDLVRFSIDAGQITVAATGQVEGTPLNQFSMDEYNGVFRIVTTRRQVNRTPWSDSDDAIVSTTDTANGVYLLDMQLQPLGSITDIAPGERVYSVRFMGDMGYFVTFRETDPLFSVDLSDPQDPKILGALKIPGFSSYLHPYGQGRLFGFGMDADENGVTKGLKLSMFDTANPTDVRELYTSVLEQQYSDALYDHKALFVQPQKNMIGFAAEDRYLIYGYGDSTGFTLRADLPGNYAARGVYIGDAFYLCGKNQVDIYSMDTFAPLATVALQQGSNP